MNMDEIREIMLGHLVDNIELGIMTPLKSTFQKLKERLTIEETYNKVFFENCVFNINKETKKGLLILSPQGVASKDIVELFSNTNILFFGLAGSLNTEIEIGSFVEVKVATDEKKESVELVITGKLKTVKCGYSPCILGTLAKKYCDDAKAMNCDVVDMETAYCAKTSIEKNNKFIALLLISDMPEVINFWEISPQIQSKLKENRMISLDKIVEYINILVEKEWE